MHHALNSKVGLIPFSTPVGSPGRLRSYYFVPKFSSFGIPISWYPPADAIWWLLPRAVRGYV